MSNPKIFISRSFDDRDREIFEHVRDFCEQMGFQPIDTERPAPKIPSEKVQDAIDDASAFLGLLTVDHSNPASNGTRPWITTEMGMASTARLPMLLFLEEGVKAEVANHFTSHGEFCRENLTPFWKRLVGALVALKETVQLGGKDTIKSTDPYWFNRDDVEMELSAEGVLEITRHLVVESNSTELALIQQRKRITTSDKLGYDQNTLNLFSTDGKHTITLHEKKYDRQEVLFDITFEPPLRKGETTRFTIHQSSKGSLPLTAEDLAHLEEEGAVNRKFVARQGHSVKEATRRLSFELRFPDGYEISEYDPRVEVVLRDRLGVSDSIERENNRFREGAFSIRYNRLILELENPLKDHAYYFVWDPPPSGNLPDSLNLNIF